MLKFLGADGKIEISNFIGWFCLKDNFFEKKTDAAVFFREIEGIWKVSAKYELCFKFQPTQEW